MKHETHREYDPDASDLAERALLSAWAGLGAWQHDLVLVGGLVPTYLCSPNNPAIDLPRPVTLDADLGIAIGASMGQYGSLQMDLQSQGFRFAPDAAGRVRLVRAVGEITVPLDFLTESPTASEGTAIVDGIPASVTPGINRALLTARIVKVQGLDLQGARQSCEIRVCEVGPFLMLKLRAFARRQAPKDAFDILYTMLHCDRGIQFAVESFAEEFRADNPAARDAIECLSKHFANEKSSAPVRAAIFAFGDPGASDTSDTHLRRQLIQQQTVDAGLRLRQGLKSHP